MNELIVELFKKGYSSYKIAEEIGMSQTGIMYRLKKLGLSAPKVKTSRFCIICNQLIKGKGKKYCGNDCTWMARFFPEIQRWINGEISGSGSGNELRDSFKKYLKRLAGDKCSKCSWSEPNPILKRPILTIDHIDGNWANNEINNLVVLCYNCHTLTETFGALNKNARGKRRNGSRSGKDK